MKLTSEEKKTLREAIRLRCMGTQLQHHADFAAYYLGDWAISLLEERDNIFTGEKNGQQN